MLTSLNAQLVSASIARLFRLQALLKRMHIWIERVASEENISDLPSRESYDLMTELGATWREPTVASLFMQNL